MTSVITLVDTSQAKNTFLNLNICPIPIYFICQKCKHTLELITHHMLVLKVGQNEAEKH
jgi:hypothetical protein